MDKKNVCIVMSTYNGEKYISTQLESIINQKDVDLQVYIRDDGSTDNTPYLLNQYSKKFDNIIVSLENNIGFRKSFLKALKDSPDCDYYCFSDQDDYWFPEKVYSSIKLLESRNASLAFGNAVVTDEKLCGNGLLYNNEDIPEFPVSLTSSNTHGFLFCFDRNTRNLAVRFPIEKFTIPHDFWLITVSDLFGSITRDMNLVVARYRRLPNSISKRKPVLLFFKRLEALVLDKGIVSDYSRYILDIYKDDLSRDKKRLVYACAYYKEKWNCKKYLLKYKKIKFKYKIKVLFNRL